MIILDSNFCQLQVLILVISKQLFVCFSNLCTMGAKKMEFSIPLKMNQTREKIILRTVYKCFLYFLEELIIPKFALKIY